ncbi:hypothetical protein [Bosea vestrisii]|jgi:hypothetical protein|uniref:Uncharacterized protein n=1 Tax=Bosea vestrisii TaxID=151416 RepID=A0ABW0H793_9HYPH
MTEVTVFLGASASFKGREYVVRRNDDGSRTVLAVIRRRPVNARGFYQREEVYRTIKPGTANFRAALKEADYRTALAKNGSDA